MREISGRKQKLLWRFTCEKPWVYFWSAVPGDLDVVLTALTGKKLAQASVEWVFEDASDLLLGYVLGNGNDEPRIEAALPKALALR